MYHRSHDQHRGGGVWLPSMHHRSHDLVEPVFIQGGGGGLHPVGKGRGLHPGGVCIQGEGV